MAVTFLSTNRWNNLRFTIIDWILCLSIMIALTSVYLTGHRHICDCHQNFSLFVTDFRIRYFADSLILVNNKTLNICGEDSRTVQFSKYLHLLYNVLFSCAPFASVFRIHDMFYYGHQFWPPFVSFLPWLYWFLEFSRTEESCGVFPTAIFFIFHYIIDSSSPGFSFYQSNCAFWVQYF